jgi:hypothetical protein
MGTKGKVAMVGKQGIIKIGGLVIEVEIVDYKNSYGRDRWQVAPLRGQGDIWTEQDPLANLGLTDGVDYNYPTQNV